MAQLFYRRLGRLKRFGSSWSVRLALSLIALCLVAFIVGRQQSRRTKRANPLASCPECSCNCPPDLLSMSMPVDIFNNSVLNKSLSAYTNCGGDDLEMSREIQKDAPSLLSEEINLFKDAMHDNLERAEKSLKEVKTVSSHYQKEAEKCFAGTTTCEEARERAQASLVAERKISELWEQRARAFGWNDEQNS